VLFGFSCAGCTLALKDQGIGREAKIIPNTMIEERTKMTGMVAEGVTTTVGRQRGERMRLQRGEGMMTGVGGQGVVEVEVEVEVEEVEEEPGVGVGA